MQALIQPIPAFTDNYIWAIHDPELPRCCIVDPGDAKPVIDYIEQHQLTLDTILITHHHADHMGGLDALAKRYHPTVYGPQAKVSPSQSHQCQQGDTVHGFGDHLQWTVIETPGHTLDHIAYYGHGSLFCGDTLFAGGCGRLFEGTAKQMLSSLQTLCELPDDTLVYCAHEYTLANLSFAITVDPDNTILQNRLQDTKHMRTEQQSTIPSTLALEKQTNPFLRCDQPSLQQQLNTLSTPKAERTLATFAACRKLKDAFKH